MAKVDRNVILKRAALKDPCAAEENVGTAWLRNDEVNLLATPRSDQHAPLWSLESSSR
jgi:hypothetical protein